MQSDRTVIIDSYSQGGARRRQPASNIIGSSKDTTQNAATKCLQIHDHSRFKRSPTSESRQQKKLHRQCRTRPAKRQSLKAVIGPSMGGAIYIEYALRATRQSMASDSLSKLHVTLIRHWQHRWRRRRQETNNQSAIQYSSTLEWIAQTSHFLFSCSV